MSRTRDGHEWSGLGAALDARKPDSVELKALLDADSTEHLLRQLRRCGWRAGSALRRDVYLADTPGLTLAGRGVVVRVRRSGDTVRSVVKVRRRTVDGLPPRSRFPALHVELDALPGGHSWTASLAATTSATALRSVLRGDTAPSSLLRRRQRELLAAAAPAADPADLRLYGPIRTLRIRLRPRAGRQPAGSRTILDVWRVSERELREVSITCRPGAAVSLAHRATRTLAGSELDLSDVQAFKAPTALAQLAAEGAVTRRRRPGGRRRG